MSSFQAIDRRWLLLIPSDATVVTVTERPVARKQVLALAASTRVALVGGRRLRRIARRAGMRIEAEYVVLPSLAAPVAITQVSGESLRWTSGTVLTVPSGITRGHAALWWAVRLVKAMPRLLARVPAGDRILLGVRS